MSASVSASRCGASYQISVAASPARSAARMRPNAGATGGLARRREAQDQERQRRQARKHQRGDRGIRARAPRRPAAPPQALRAPGDSPGRTPAAHRHPIPARRACPAATAQHRRNGGILVVLVQRPQLHFRANRGEQPCGVARVLAEDQIGGQQRLPRARREVAKVADRSGNQHKTIGRGGLSVLPGLRRCGACFVGHSCSFSAH